MSLDKSLTEFKQIIENASKTQGLDAPDGKIFAGTGYNLLKATVPSPTSSASSGEDEGFNIVASSTQISTKNTIDDATIVKAFYNIFTNLAKTLSASGIASLTLSFSSSKNRTQLFNDLNNAFSVLFDPSYPENNETFYILAASFQKVIGGFIEKLAEYNKYIPEKYRNAAKNFVNSLQFIFKSVINTNTINKLIIQLDTQLENTQLSTEDKLKLIQEAQEKILQLNSDAQDFNREFSVLFKNSSFFENVSKKTELMFEESSRKLGNTLQLIQAKAESLQATKSTSEVEDNVSSSSTSKTTSSATSSTTTSPEDSLSEEATIAPEIPTTPASTSEAITQASPEISTHVDTGVKAPASVQTEAPVEMVETPVNPKTPENVQTEKKVEEPVKIETQEKPETSPFSFETFNNLWESFTQPTKNEPSPKKESQEKKSETAFSFSNIIDRLSSQKDALGKKIVDVVQDMQEKAGSPFSSSEKQEELDKKRMRDEFHKNITMEDAEDKPFPPPNEGENTAQITDDLIPLPETKNTEKTTPNIRIRDIYAPHILPADDVIHSIEAAKPHVEEISTTTTPSTSSAGTINESTETVTTDTPPRDQTDTDTSLWKTIAFVGVIVALTVIGATLGFVFGGGIPGAIAGGFAGAFVGSGMMAIPTLESSDKESRMEDQESEKNRFNNNGTTAPTPRPAHGMSPIQKQIPGQRVVTPTLSDSAKSEDKQTNKTP